MSLQGKYDKRLLKTRWAFVFKIPSKDKKKLTKLQRYRIGAAGWDAANPERICKLSVLAMATDSDSTVQKSCLLQLKGGQGKIFGEAVISCYPGGIESPSKLRAVTDSSRYFTLEIVKQNSSGEVDVVGVGFSESTYAADLTKALENYFGKQNDDTKNTLCNKRIKIEGGIDQRITIPLKVSSSVIKTKIKVEAVALQPQELPSVVKKKVGPVYQRDEEHVGVSKEAYSSKSKLKNCDPVVGKKARDPGPSAAKRNTPDGGRPNDTEMIPVIATIDYRTTRCLHRTVQQQIDAGGAHVFYQPGNLLLCHMCPFTVRTTGRNFEPIFEHWKEEHALCASKCICNICTLVFVQVAEAVKHKTRYHKGGQDYWSSIQNQASEEHEVPAAAAEQYLADPGPSSGASKPEKMKKKGPQKKVMMSLKSIRRVAITEGAQGYQSGCLFMCHLCPVTFKSARDKESLLVIHWKHFHGLSSVDKCVCKTCCLIFLNQDQAHRHQQMFHNYKCSQCPAVFPMEMTLLVHRRVVHKHNMQCKT